MGFQLTIVTPERPVVDAEVDSVVVPGQEGEFGVLPAHEPFLAAIAGGVLRYTSNGKTSEVKVGDGFAEVSLERVTVLAQSAEAGSDATA